LRDLAVLIVIDFIDMDEKRNNRSVERRLKECLKHDRARIQVGRISHFGLLEMSRQRIRTSVLESSTDKCPHCGGTGHVRSVASVALQVLRMIEETLQRGGTHNLVARTRSDIAIYVLNHKRAHLRDLEERFQIVITINADATMGGQTPFLIDRGEQVHSVEQARAIAAAQPTPAPLIEPQDEAPFAEDEAAVESEDGASAEHEGGEDEEFAEAAPSDAGHDDMHGEADGETGGSGDGTRRRRRRRRRGRRGEGREGGEFGHEAAPERAAAPYDAEGANGSDAGEDAAAEGHEAEHADAGEPRENGAHLNGEGEADGERRRRRRGRRGGRRNRRDREGEERAPDAQTEAHGGDEQGGHEYGGHEHGGHEHGGHEHRHEHGGHEGDDRPGVEPRLADAVADFGGPPAVTHEVTQPATPAEPPTHHDVASAEPPAPAEPPRRRSTVREPAPSAFDDGASPPVTSAPVPATPEPEQQPAQAEQPQEDAKKPRRTGWWAKRVLGG